MSYYNVKPDLYFRSIKCGCFSKLTFTSFCTIMIVQLYSQVRAAGVTGCDSPFMPTGLRKLFKF